MRSFPVTIMLLLLATAPPTSASDATRISWATATKGGGFQLFGENVADVINATDSGLKVEALATKGSRQNLRLLEAGEVDVVVSIPAFNDNLRHALDVGYFHDVECSKFIGQGTPNIGKGGIRQLHDPVVGHAKRQRRDQNQPPPRLRPIEHPAPEQTKQECPDGQQHQRVRRAAVPVAEEREWVDPECQVVDIGKRGTDRTD